MAMNKRYVYCALLPPTRSFEETILCLFHQYYQTFIYWYLEVSPWLIKRPIYCVICKGVLKKQSNHYICDPPVLCYWHLEVRPWSVSCVFPLQMESIHTIRSLLFLCFLSITSQSELIKKSIQIHWSSCYHLGLHTGSCLQGKWSTIVSLYHVKSFFEIYY